MRIVGNAFQIALWQEFNSFTSRWQRIDINAMDDIGHRALCSLNDAGLVEVRLGVDVEWLGYSYRLQAIFEVCGANTEAEVIRQIKEMAEGAPGWVDEHASQCKARIDILPMAGRLTARGVSLRPPHYSQEDTLGTMGSLIQKKLPVVQPSVNLVDFRLWTPSATANEARDKWIYEQCKNLVKYSQIIDGLADKWNADEAIQSIQGIKRAATRYATTHHLSPIPSRQPGRPAKNKRARRK